MPDPVVTLPGGLSFTWTSAVTFTILAVVALVETLKLLGRMERVEAALGEVLKEVAVLFTVVYFITNLGQFVSVSAASPKAVIGDLQNVVDEAYCRVVKMEQCIANIRLSGPAAGYAGYAEAKFSKYRPLYDQALWLYNQLVGVAKYLAVYGPVLMSAGMLIYAAWLRKVGGMIIGVVGALWVGLALVAYAAAGNVAFVCKAGEGVWGEDFKPVVSLGCDGKIVDSLRVLKEDWQLVIAYAWLFLVVAPAVGAAVGYLLGL